MKQEQKPRNKLVVDKEQYQQFRVGTRTLDSPCSSPPTPPWGRVLEGPCHVFSELTIRYVITLTLCGIYHHVMFNSV